MDTVASMNLRELLGDAPFVCGPETSLIEVAAAMERSDLEAAAVVEGLELMGLVTESDLRRAVASDVDLRAAIPILSTPISMYGTLPPGSPSPVIGISRWLTTMGHCRVSSRFVTFSRAWWIPSDPDGDLFTIWLRIGVLTLMAVGSVERSSLDLKQT
jgi:CBS domain-containing protein